MCTAESKTLIYSLDALPPGVVRRHSGAAKIDWREGITRIRQGIQQRSILDGKDSNYRCRIRKRKELYPVRETVVLGVALAAVAITAAVALAAVVAAIDGGHGSVVQSDDLLVLLGGAEAHRTGGRVARAFAWAFAGPERA